MAENFADLYEEFLEVAGVSNFEELREDEREAYEQLFNNVRERALVLDDVKKFISSSAAAVSRQLATEKITSRRDTVLKARLQNYLALLSFMVSPAEASENIRAYIDSMKVKKGLGY